MTKTTRAMWGNRQTLAPGWDAVQRGGGQDEGRWSFACFASMLVGFAELAYEQITIS